MLLTGAILPDGSPADITLAAERIRSIDPVGTARTDPGGPTLDLTGYVVLPAFAEPHAHLDKAYTADRVVSTDGTLAGAVAAWRTYRRTLDVDEIRERAHAACLSALAHGVTAMRSHVDVGEGIGVRGVEALVQVRKDLGSLFDLQVVAFCHPLSGPEGQQNRRLVEQAVAAGADVLGGAPHLDPDPAASLHTCLQLAQTHGLPLDLHMDEHLGERLDLAALARLVAAGVPQPVTASHAVSLGMASAEVQDQVAAAVAAAGISVVTLPMTNLFLQGRDRPSATPRGLTAIAALVRAGVVVAAGEDNVQDPFNPLGRGDPLGTAQLLVLAGHVDPPTAVKLVSSAARAVMGLPAVDIRPGDPADLVAVAGPSLRAVVATATQDRVVVRRGRVVSRTQVRADLP